VTTSEHRLVEARVRNAVAQAEALATVAPEFGSTSHLVAEGSLVLWGPDLYLNRTMAAGLQVPLTASDLDRIVQLCDASAVPASVEVTPTTHPQTLTALAMKGFMHDPDSNITALVKPVSDHPINAPSSVIVREVATAEDLALWRQTSLAGWGHTTVRAQHASNSFVAAVDSLDEERLVLAFDGDDDQQPVGCATTTFRDGVAILGGMSTVPAHRRRGVHAALLHHRFAAAANYGCDLIAATAATGSVSERNLRRHGFIPEFTIAIHTLPGTG